MAFGNKNTIQPKNKKINDNSDKLAMKNPVEHSSTFPLHMKINLPMNLIDVNPKNSKYFSIENIESLAEKIKSHGFEGTILVFDKKDGRYEIYSGERRFRAMQLLGQKYIPAIIDELPEKESDKIARLLAANSEARNLSAFEIGNMYRAYIDEVLIPNDYKGDKIEAIIKFFPNTSKTSVKRYLNINKLIPELQEICKINDFPFSAFDKLPAMDVEKQQLLYKQLQLLNQDNPDYSALGKKEIVEMVNWIKENDNFDNFIFAKNQSQIQDNVAKNSLAENQSFDNTNENNATNNIEETDSKPQTICIDKKIHSLKNNIMKMTDTQITINDKEKVKEDLSEILLVVETLLEELER